jgi:hypothetical protein
LHDFKDGMLDFKTNNIPKSMVTLGRLFDLQGRFKKITNVNSSTLQYDIMNLETKKYTKTINLSSCCIDVER